MAATTKRMKFSALDFALGTGFGLLVNGVFFGERYLSDGKIFLLATFCTCAVGVGLSHLHQQLAVSLNRFLAARKNEQQQLGYHLLFFPLTAAVITALFFGYHWLNFPGYVLEMSNYKVVLLIGFVADLVGIGFGQALHSAGALKQAALEKEQLQKQQLQSQLEILKNQVNPHFLFNSLNVLSSLISENPQKAEAFVNQLSNVYSYLLRNNQQEWTTLKAELDFIRAYAYLLGTRYGDGVRVDFAVPEDCWDRLLPPLTLQLLVENAVKHNVIHRSKPLCILIAVKGESLLVRNNLQKKSRQQVNSHGIGLKNIAEKYRLMHGRTISVDEGAESFSVTLPLLMPSAVLS